MNHQTSTLVQTSSAISNLFDLKLSPVELIDETIAAEQVAMTIEELEAIRTAAHVLPASKYGLEVLCGASCETGAQ